MQILLINYHKNQPGVGCPVHYAFIMLPIKMNPKSTFFPPSICQVQAIKGKYQNKVPITMKLINLKEKKIKIESTRMEDPLGHSFP